MICAECKGRKTVAGKVCPRCDGKGTLHDDGSGIDPRTGELLVDEYGGCSEVFVPPKQIPTAPAADVHKGVAIDRPASLAEVWGAILQNADSHGDKEPSMTMFEEEMCELGRALAGEHEHPPEWELVQIAGIAVNWLRRLGVIPPPRRDLLAENKRLEPLVQIGAAVQRMGTAEWGLEHSTVDVGAPDEIDVWEAYSRLRRWRSDTPEGVLAEAGLMEDTSMLDDQGGPDDAETTEG